MIRVRARTSRGPSSARFGGDARANFGGGRDARAPRGAERDAEGAPKASVSEAAWRLLSIRVRSRDELRQRLLRKGLAESDVDAELDRLQERGYLDDEAFARSWVATRQSGSAPRGSAMLHAELRSKGIDVGIAREAVAAGDDVAAAAVAARKRAGALTALPRAEFRRRLFRYLQRRGFGYDAARAAVYAAWLDGPGAAREPEDFV
jgi:regulatory protein